MSGARARGAPASERVGESEGRSPSEQDENCLYRSTVWHRDPGRIRVPLPPDRRAPRAKAPVEVLTTCAQDYITWKNEYPEGTDRIRGVTVRRFANARTRDLEAFNRYSEWIFNSAHTREDEMEWLRQQGPWCPALQEYLERNQQQYDILIFFTYLYAPTVLGVRVAPHKSILVPTAHDEPAIHLEIYKEMFSRAGGHRLQHRRRAPLPHDALLDPRHRRGDGRLRRRPLSGAGLPARQVRGRAEGRARRREPIPEDERSPSWRPHLAGRGVLFKRRHRLHGPLALYGGRIDPGKGCEELIEYFSSYVQEGGDASLVLMGVKLMPLPEEPFIHFAGRLPDNERLQALEAATVVVVPSPYESLSLLALEAFAVGTPVLANARSEVLVEHCHKSNAGLYYADRDEFVEAMKLLVADHRLRGAMARNGRAYVRKNYRWDVIIVEVRTDVRKTARALNQAPRSSRRTP